MGRSSVLRRHRIRQVVLALALALFGCVAGGLLESAEAAPTARVSFSREVRPILSEHCFACHGPDEKTRKAGLRLDREQDALAVLKSGHRALVAGDLNASKLVSRVLESDPDEIMPPPSTKKPLGVAKIEILRRWVAEGAKFEGHWAYLPVKRPEKPAVGNPEWPANEIDHFVLAKLEKEGLAPAAPASKETILRRASLDLTGLPPTVEELDAFLSDTDPKAYEKVVDRLLASPHYGERMAQTWLDLARFGETQGYHHDRHRDLWHWRDWVIRAFNSNLPYDRFTTEQLAGDLLPNPTRDQLVATGFHRNEMTTSEGGALPEEYSVKYVVGRVDTTARVWLGSSMACAECHDHKYDPISQREFYQFFAFFNRVPENGLDAEELNPVPSLTLESEADRARLAGLDAEVRALDVGAKMILDSPQSEWDGSQATWERHHREKHVRGWTALDPVAAWVSDGSRLEKSTEQSIVFEPGSQVRRYETEFPISEGTGFSGLRFEVVPKERPSGQGTPAEADSFRVGGITGVLRAKDPTQVRAKSDRPRQGNWHRAGPFAAGSAKEAHDKAFGPESARDTKGTFQEGKVRWDEQVEWIDGEEIALRGENTAHYLFRTVGVNRSQARLAWIRFSGGLQIWLNDRRVLGREAVANSGSETNAVLLWFRPGENRLILKTSQGVGDGRLVFRLADEASTEVPIEWAAAVADGAGEGAGPQFLVDADPKTGWGGAGSRRWTAWLRTHDVFEFPGGGALHLTMVSSGTGGAGLPERFRVAVSSAPDLDTFFGLPEGVRATLALDPDVRSDAQKAEVRQYYRRRNVAEFRDADRLLAARRKERDDFRRSWPSTMVMRDAEKPKDTFLLVRGQYNQRGEKVSAGVPTQLHRWNESFPKNRLGLARWLLDPEHPLTARVAVNQFWQRIFGTGLVKTAEEFGSQGEWPSHPELLDWLASEFVGSAWNMKALHRAIVLSSTYRQDSAVTPAVLERDPENRWFTRGPRFRMEAEGIRDIAMATSGLLDPKIGGPSVFPYQPPGLWGQVSFEGTRDYVQGSGSENYRRGLYTYWRRSIPYASFTVFDAPTRETCTVRRPRTNTPLQALNLLNDPVYVEAARALGLRILRKGGTTAEERVTYAVRVCLGRSPTAREAAVLVAASDREFARFSKDREGANRLVHSGASRPPIDVDIAELAAWTVVGSTLLNLDEAITKG